MADGFTVAQKEAVSFSNPEEDRSGVPSPADAEPPFNNPSADLILRTSDNVKFRVWKSILREASPVFADMFALGRRPIQPSQFDVDSDGGGDHKPSLSSSSLELEPILDLPELTSTTLRCLLLTIYPPPTYAFTSLDDLKAVLSAAHKYQMDAVMDSLEDVLVRDFVRKETLRVFCIATLYNRPSVREAAARRFLALPPVSAAEAYVDELQDIDARSYHQLLACRRQCASVLAEATRTLSWFQDGAWVFTSLVACGCGRDEISRPLRGPDGGEVGRHIKRWFIAHYERCASALQDKPCGEALEDPALCDQALREATRCDKCRENVYDHMRIFMKSLREYVDGKVSQITTGIYCHS